MYLSLRRTWSVVEYGAHHILNAPRPPGEWLEPRNIFWKNFTNIDRLVTKVGSNKAPGCTYEYGAVYMLAPESGWWLSMVHHILDVPTLEWSSNIVWKNFTNIDRLVMKVGSNKAPGHEPSNMRPFAVDHDSWLSMVLITFWTLYGQLREWSGNIWKN